MDAEEKKATKKAMDLLLRMDQTEKGLYDKLIRAGFSEKAVTTAMSYVKSFGYLDDLRYAQNYIGFHKEQYSRKELRYKLAGRGVPPDVVDQGEGDCLPDEKGLFLFRCAGSDGRSFRGR